MTPASRHDRANAPLKKLSLNLNRTYESIHPKLPAMEKGGHAEKLLPMGYQGMEILGRGSFGKVYRANDLQRNKSVAIKVTKAHKEGRLEVRILKLVNQFQTRRFVRLIDSFTLDNTHYTVLELLSCSLLDILRASSFKGVSLKLVRKFGRQLTEALRFLDFFGVIHCDIKPENICLCAGHSDLKIIDFGCSCRRGAHINTYVQSRFYRAPEVLLRLAPFTSAIDMWSLGCILIEVHTGTPLFPGCDELDQLRKIGKVLGPPPAQMMPHKKQRDLFSKLADEESVSVDDILGVSSGGPGGRYVGIAEHGSDDYRMLKDLVSGMLEYDPAKRITPVRALDHEFFCREQRVLNTSCCSEETNPGTDKSEPSEPIDA